MNKYKKNPLKELSESEFQDFLIAKENDFVKITEMGKVIVDHSKWYDTFHNLQWHCYFNHKKICNEKKVTLSKTLEIMDLLILEKRTQLHTIRTAFGSL